MKFTRSLGSYEILSTSWLEMSDTFSRLSTIVEIESKLTTKTLAKTTLWDTEEQGIKFLIEDGKLNQCLR